MQSKITKRKCIFTYPCCCSHHQASSTRPPSHPSVKMLQEMRFCVERLFRNAPLDCMLHRSAATPTKQSCCTMRVHKMHLFMGGQGDNNCTEKHTFCILYQDRLVCNVLVSIVSDEELLPIATLSKNYKQKHLCDLCVVYKHALRVYNRV